MRTALRASTGVSRRRTASAAVPSLRAVRMGASGTSPRVSRVLWGRSAPAALASHRTSPVGAAFRASARVPGMACAWRVRTSFRAVHGVPPGAPRTLLAAGATGRHRAITRLGWALLLAVGRRVLREGHLGRGAGRERRRAHGKHAAGERHPPTETSFHRVLLWARRRARQMGPLSVVREEPSLAGRVRRSRTRESSTRFGRHVRDEARRGSNANGRSIPARDAAAVDSSDRGTCPGIAPLLGDRRSSRRRPAPARTPSRRRRDQPTLALTIPHTSVTSRRAAAPRK